MSDWKLESKQAHQGLVDALKTRGLPENVWQRELYYGSLLTRPANEITSPANGVNLFDYVESYHYCEVQPEFFRFMLPELVRVWGSNLLGESGGLGGYAEHFMAAFAAKPPHPTYLNEEQFDAFSNYVAALIFERMGQERMLGFEDQHATAHEWFYALGSYMVVFPHLHRFWDRWWEMEEESLAVCAIQYISCLMYDDEDNPVFGSWTPESGGGAPQLWESDGHIYEHSADSDNVVYLEETLTVDLVRDGLDRARSVLTNPHAIQFVSDMIANFDEQLIFLEDHLEKLPGALRRPKADNFSWADL